MRCAANWTVSGRERGAVVKKPPLAAPPAAEFDAAEQAFVRSLQTLRDGAAPGTSPGTSPGTLPDTATRARLAALRAAAVERAERPPHTARWSLWAPAGAAAAALVWTLALSVWRAPLPPALPAAPPYGGDLALPLPPEMLEVLSDGTELVNLYQDLDFYQWFDEQGGDSADAGNA